MAGNLPNDSDGKSGCIDENSFVHLVIDNDPILSVYTLSYDDDVATRFTSSPAENGTEIIDGKFNVPASVNIVGVIKASDYSTVEKIRQSVRSNKKILCKFYGKAGMLDNMLIERIHSRGTSQRLDAVEVSISLKQWMGIDPK